MYIPQTNRKKLYNAAQACGFNGRVNSTKVQKQCVALGRVNLKVQWNIALTKADILTICPLAPDFTSVDMHLP